MEAGGTTWGAIKVYSKAAGAYDERADDVLRRFAGQAAIFVSNVHTAQSAKSIGDDLKGILRSRDVIATAAGMVMVRKKLDHAGAYRQLVSLARGAHIPLHELAERLVASPVPQGR
jgi:hypothetical protein